MDLASQMNNNLQHMMSIFTSRMSEFEKILAEQVSGSSGTPQTVKALAAEYTGFKSFILDAITILKKEIELLVHGYDHLESQSRRKVLLFHGLPEKKDEVLQDRIVTLINDQMKIADFNDNGIATCHRLGEFKKDRSRPVLVRFSQLRTRSTVWNAKTKLKGTKVSVKEFLTKPRQEVFTAARKHFGITKCWSADGIIVILLPNGTRKKITSMHQLQELQSQHAPNQVTSK
ncbi:hypothetical protein ACJJTC_019352 [Scirpophaga incertulas]